MTTRWICGDEALRVEVDRFLRDPAQYDCERLGESNARRTVRVALPALGASIVVKEFRRPASPSGRAIAQLRAGFGRSSARREWRALVGLRSAGVPVPEPLALARRSGGAELVVMRFVPNAGTLDRRLADDPAEKRRLLCRVGELVHRLHDAGYVHGDLHVGNVLVTETGPLLVDLQRVRPLERSADRVRDVAFLDFSLYHAGETRANRMRYRIAALGLGRFRVAAERELLREVGRASHARALDYYDGRTRRSLREGEGFCALVCDEGRGMRVEAFEAEAAQQALAAHRRAIAQTGPARLKRDHRSNVTRVRVAGRPVVVKEVVKTNLKKRLADVLRGSPGRRAWLAGHGLRIRGIGAALPLAFVERRSRGVPVWSAVVLEDLGEAPCVADLAPGEVPATRLGLSLLRLLLRLHRTGTLHGDLQAIHIYLDKRAERGAPMLIDLEGVRFPGVLRDAHRIEMFSQLNASVGDDVLPAPLRCDLFDRYRWALPFERGSDRALREIVRRSRARNQRWKGTDCELSRRGGGW